MLRRLQHRVQFGLERLVLRGTLYRLGVIVVLLGMVALLGGLIIYLLSDDFERLPAAVWWAALRLSDPGYLGEDQSAFARTLSAVLTALGATLFFGGVVAILTQALDSTMRRLQLGLTPIAQSNHVLILGWTTRTATLVRELLSSEERVKRFLQARGARNLHIVILVDEVTAELVQTLRDRLGGLYQERRITLRSGSPLRLEHLHRVDFLRASAILLPATDQRGRTGNADDRALKVLMSIDSLRRRDGAELPLVVAELHEAQMLPVAHRAYRGPIELLASDLILARLIIQTVRHPGLSHVLKELLSQEYGSELYIRGADGLAGERFGELAGYYPRAVPIGLLRPHGDALQPLLNPSPDFRVEADDRLVFVAGCYADTDGDTGGRRQAGGFAVAPQRPESAARRRRVLVLGWNDRVPALVDQFDRFQDEQIELDVLSRLAVESRDELLARWPATGRVRLRQLVGDYAVPGELGAVLAAGYHNVIILASDRLDSEVDADTRVITGYLMLDSLLAAGGRRPEILVELLDPENVELFAARRDDVLVSPIVLSHMLSQVTLRRDLAVVFEELFRAGGPEIFLVPSRDYGIGDGSLEFETIRRLAAARGQVALGVRVAAEAAEPHGGVHLNPPRQRSWRLGSLDELIVLTHYE